MVVTSQLPELRRDVVQDGMDMLASSLSFVINGPTWVRRRPRLYLDVVGVPMASSLSPTPGMVDDRIPTILTPLAEATHWREVAAHLTGVLRADEHHIQAVDDNLPAFAPFRSVLDEAERTGWSSWSELAPVTRRGNRVSARRTTETGGTRVTVTVDRPGDGTPQQQLSFVVRDVGWVFAIGAVARTVWTSPSTFELRPVVTAGTTYWGPVVRFGLDDGLAITGVQRHG